MLFAKQAFRLQEIPIDGITAFPELQCARQTLLSLHQGQVRVLANTTHNFGSEEGTLSVQTAVLQKLAIIQQEVRKVREVPEDWNAVERYAFINKRRRFIVSPVSLNPTSSTST